MLDLFTPYFFAHMILFLAIMFNIGLFTKQNGWKISGAKITYKWWGVVGVILFFISIALFIYSTKSLDTDYAFNDKSKQTEITLFLQDSLYIGYFIHLITFMLTFILNAHGSSIEDELYITVNEIYIILLSLIFTTIPVAAYLSICHETPFGQAIFIIVQAITGISIVITAVSETKTVRPDNIAVPNSLGIILIIIIIVSIIFSAIIRAHENDIADKEKKKYEQRITNLNKEILVLESSTGKIEKDLENTTEKIDSNSQEIITRMNDFQRESTELGQEIQYTIDSTQKKNKELLETTMDKNIKKTVEAIDNNLSVISKLFKISQRNDSTIINNIAELFQNVSDQYKVIIEHTLSTSQALKDSINRELTDLTESLSASNKQVLEKLNKDNKTLFKEELKSLLQKINSLEFTVDSLRKNYKDINIKLKE